MYVGDCTQPDLVAQHVNATLSLVVPSERLEICLGLKAFFLSSAGIHCSRKCIILRFLVLHYFCSRLLGVRLVDFSSFLACVFFWLFLASWLCSWLLGFSPQPPALLKPSMLTAKTHVTTMFAVGAGCAEHFVCK